MYQASSTSSLAYTGKDAPNMEDYKIALRTDQTGFLERPKKALWSGLESGSDCLSEHRVGVVRGGRHRLQHIPVLNDLAIGIEAEDVDAGGFLTAPVQVTHVYKG